MELKEVPYPIIEKDGKFCIMSGDHVLEEHEILAHAINRAYQINEIGGE